MAVTNQIFDFFVEPIREADRRQGDDFLKRYLVGPQQIWEDYDAKAKSLGSLWSPADCPENAVQFLAWIVGWTSQLSYVTRELTTDELRRLIQVSAKLWKTRGPETTLVDVLTLVTTARCRVINWFGFRWVLGEEYISEEHDGLDPWVISLPGGDAMAEYVSNLRIVDDGTLNRNLVERLVELMRAMGETWEITYLGFLDLFTFEGDTTLWDLTDAPTLPQVVDGTLELFDEGTVRPLSAAEWRSASYFAKVRLVDTGTAPSLHLDFLIDTGSDARYRLELLTEADGSNPSQLTLTKFATDGTPEVIGQVDLHYSYPIYLGTWYGVRVTVVDDQVERLLTVFVDGAQLLQVVDTIPVVYLGSFELTLPTDDCELNFDEVEVLPIPTPADALEVLSVEDMYFSGSALGYSILYAGEFTWESVGSAVPAFRWVGSKLFQQVEDTHRVISQWSYAMGNQFTTKVGCGVWDNVIDDPRNPNGGDRVYETAVTSEHYVQSSDRATDDTHHYVYIFYLIPYNRSHFEFENVGAGTDPARVRLDTDTMTVSFPDGGKVPEWYRLIEDVEGWIMLAFGVDGIASDYTASKFRVCDASWNFSYLGVYGDGAYFWGAEIQRTVGRILPSWIYASSGTTTEKSKDNPSWQAQYRPAWIKDYLAFAFEVIFHEYDSTMFEDSGIVKYFWAIAGSEAIVCYLSATRTIVVWSSDTGILVETDPVTWDWDQRCEVQIISDDGGVGRIVLSGFLTGNGSYDGDFFAPDSTADLRWGRSGYYGQQQIDALMEACPRRVFL